MVVSEVFNEKDKILDATFHYAERVEEDAYRSISITVRGSQLGINR